MIKKEKGITLVTLVITIIVMLIIASTTIYLSIDRFELNDLRKMINDLELLEDKVSNYYSTYGVLPVLRSNNTSIKYTYTSLNFKKNAGDNSNYYILDLSAMGNLALNYGEEGFENPNATNDTYIINEASRTIYYVKGIERDGKTYHFINPETAIVADDIPPTTPEIKVISGIEKVSGFYVTEVYVDIIAGKDNWAGVNYTSYSLNNGNTWNEFSGSNSVIKLSEGVYYIKAKTYDNNNLSSAEVTLTLEVHTEHTYENTNTEPTCTEPGTKIYTCTNAKCGATYIEDTPALGHDFYEEITKYASCEETGTLVKKCTRCDYYEESTIAKRDHNYVFYYGYCDVEYNKCKKCGYVDRKELTKRHVWKYSVASADGNGYLCAHKHRITFYCTDCTKVITREEGHWLSDDSDAELTSSKFDCVCGESIRYYSYYGVDEDYWRVESKASGDITQYGLQTGWDVWDDLCLCNWEAGNTVS